MQVEESQQLDLSVSRRDDKGQVWPVVKITNNYN